MSEAAPNTRAEWRYTTAAAGGQYATISLATRMPGKDVNTAFAFAAKYL